MPRCGGLARSPGGTSKAHHFPEAPRQPPRRPEATDVNGTKFRAGYARG